MAEVFLNPAFTSVRGRIGSLVFYRSRGRNFMRTYVVPRNPDSAAQRFNRNRFRDAMKAWQGLCSFDKDAYSRRAARLGMTGHNLFISRYMKSPAHGSRVGMGEDACMQDIPGSPGPCSSAHIRCHSVCASSDDAGIPVSPFSRNLLLNDCEKEHTHGMLDKY